MPTFRSATVSDIPTILALWRDAGAEPSQTDDSFCLAQLIQFAPGSLILAESESRLVGSVIAAWDGWRGSVYRLCVAPDRRRSGLGRRLVAEAEAHLSRLGATRLQAIVVASDPGATEFWRAGDWEEQVDRLRFVTGRRREP